MFSSVWAKIHLSVRTVFTLDNKTKNQVTCVCVMFVTLCMYISIWVLHTVIKYVPNCRSLRSNSFKLRSLHIDNVCASVFSSSASYATKCSSRNQPSCVICAPSTRLATRFNVPSVAKRTSARMKPLKFTSEAAALDWWCTCMF